MPWYKGVIFDLDGTLADSMGIWNKIDVDFLARRGIDVPDDYMHAIAHLGSYETAVYTIERFSLTDTPEELISEWVEMADEAYRKVDLKRGAKEYLSYLKDNGIKISIASATELSLIETALKSNGILEYVDNIVTLSEVKRPKEFPDIYLKCASLMDVMPSECIVCEDLLMAAKGAKSGGFYVIGIYDEYSAKDKDNMELICDKYIYDFKDLI